MEIVKRFSIRHGAEAEPTEPVFEDAPKRLRFFILEHLKTYINPHDALSIVSRALCKPLLIASPVPSPWFAIQHHLEACEWWEIYNLIEEIYLAQEWRGAQQQFLFQRSVNKVFGEESIGWMLDDNGRLQRLLPASVNVEVEQVFRELQAPRYAPALVLVRSARDAYNARPRSDLDVCTNIFGALESVAKEVFSQPTGTFGDVLKKARGTFSAETISTLEKVYSLANNHFRHGRTEPFALKPAETDFVYVTCLAGIMLFVRSIP